MAASIIPLCKRSQGGVVTQMLPRRISRHEAVCRLMAAARANGLSPAAAVTEENIAMVAELNLFPEYGLSSKPR